MNWDKAIPSLKLHNRLSLLSNILPVLGSLEIGNRLNKFMIPQN